MIMNSIYRDWKTVFSEFASIWWLNKRLIILSYGCLLSTVGLLLLVPWPLKVLIDEVLTHPGGSAPLHILSLSWIWPKELQVALLSAAMALLALAAAQLNSYEKLLGSRIRERVALDIRSLLLRHIETLEMHHVRRARKGELIMRLIDDVQLLSRLLCKTIPIAIKHIITTAFLLVATFLVDVRLGLVSLVMLAALALVVIFRGESLRAASMVKREEAGRLSALAGEIMQGLMHVRSMGLEQQINDQFRNNNERSLRAGVEEVRVAVRMEKTVQTLGGLSLAIIAGLGGLLVVSGDLTLGLLTVCLAYLTQLLKPVEKINEVFSGLTRGFARGLRVLDVLNMKSTVLSPSQPRSLPDHIDHLMVSNVSYAYPDSESEVLKHVDMELTAGRLCVITGHSGSGKSTLAHLLLRFVDPDVGQLFLQGIPYQDLDAVALRQQFAVCMQDTHLFAGTLRQVLTTLSTDADESRIWQVLLEVDLAEFVRQLPHRLETPVDEKGLIFSGGQRARFLLARALLSDRPIILLDEPLANVDTTSAEIIVQQIRKYSQARIVIAISHEEVLRKAADDLWVMSEGTLRRTLKPGSTANAQQPTAILHGPSKAARTDPVTESLRLQTGKTFSRVYEKTPTSRQGLVEWVYQASSDLQDTVTIRLDHDEWKASKAADTAVKETMMNPTRCEWLMQDPAFPSLRSVAEQYSEVAVLRYRPRKRLTLKAKEHGGQARILKLFNDQRGETIHRESMVLHSHEHQFRFGIAQPIAWNPAQQMLTQSYLPGKPVQAILHRGHHQSLPGQMASAIASLHSSDLQFENHFSLLDQASRSDRYCKDLCERLPVLASRIAELQSALAESMKSMIGAVQHSVPIHGSLHSHQWLLDDNDLYLVDFDRMAMGDAELDLATFVAEWDYEAPPKSASIIESFLSSYRHIREYDIEKFAFYRSHKHLAKAYKASRADREDAYFRAERNLHRALNHLECRSL